jgi:hypothetical protein
VQPIDPSPSGRLVYYTRLAAPVASTVEHRWYLNGTVRQRVFLKIPPSGQSGYRTFSRTTAAPGNWKVELRDGSGQVLGEETVDVR